MYQRCAVAIAIVLAVHALCITSLSIAISSLRQTKHARSSALGALQLEEEQAQEAMDVRGLMEILNEAFPSADKKSWNKTRRYLYQYRSSLSQPKRRKRQRGPLTASSTERVLEFLQSVFPDELQVQIIQQSPRILSQHLSIESRLRPTVDFLIKLYGKGMLYEAVRRNTDLLLVRGVGFTNKYDEDQSKTIDKYLQEEVGMNDAGIKKLKNSHPTLFQLSLESKIKPSLAFICSILGHSSASPLDDKMRKRIVKIVSNHPALLQLDIENNLKPTVSHIRQSCHLSATELASVIAANPGVMGLSVETNLKPTIRFLADTLNSHNETPDINSMLSKCVSKHPQVLALSLSNLQGKREFFDSVDGCHDDAIPRQTLAARILLSSPSTYSLSLDDNIKPKFSYLQNLWGESASNFIREYPQVLTLSFEGNILPTVSFYNMTGYLDGFGYSASAIRSRYIATSLYNRLLPRWHFLLNEQEKEIELRQLNALSGEGAPTAETVRRYLIPTKSSCTQSALLPPLHLLAGANDEVFCRQLHVSLDDYTAFKEESGPRLKFNNQFAQWLKTGGTIDLSP